MKKRSKSKEISPPALQESPGPYPAATSAETMVRTQIYLSRAEHEFLLAEAARRNTPMAAVIRGYIDEKMEVPDDTWTRNPLLNPPVEDPGFAGHEDGALNHDHYISGAPKKFLQTGNKWKAAPPLEE